MTPLWRPPRVDPQHYTPSGDPPSMHPTQQSHAGHNRSSQNAHGSMSGMYACIHACACMCLHRLDTEGFDLCQLQHMCLHMHAVPSLVHVAVVPHAGVPTSPADDSSSASRRASINLSSSSWLPTSAVSLIAIASVSATCAPCYGVPGKWTS